MARGIPSVYSSLTNPFGKDEGVLNAKQLLHGEEFLSDHPGYQDSVYSFRTGRKSPLDKKINSLGIIVEDIANQDSKLPKQDSGHEFDSIKHSVVPWNGWEPELVYHPDYRPDWWQYYGPLFHRAPFNRGELGLTQESSNNHGSMFGKLIPDVDDSYGTRAIAKVQPTKSNASIATALIELRDGLPNMPGRALKNAKGFRDLSKVGPEEFLNYMFGLVPALSDIRSIAVSIVNQKKILDQFQRDNDKVVRRKYGFPLSHSVENWSGDSYDSGFDYFGSLYNGSQPTNWFQHDGYSRSQSIHKRIWFRGAFRYHLATTDDQWGRIERTSQLMAHLLGARLDAEALWAAMPWSWLVDWFSDTGDIISNATHAILDGQLLQYGYVMCETTQINTYTTLGLRQKSGNFLKRDLTTAYVYQRKQRAKATPYGFGLNSESFSAQQWAILGSLGMTKGVNKLP